MPAREVESYLARLLASTPDSLHPLIQKFQTYYDRKYVTQRVHSILLRIFHYRLWHQLTITLKEFLDRPESQEVQVDLFKYFVLDFQKHLDKLRLAEIGVKVSKSIRGALIYVTEYEWLTMNFSKLAYFVTILDLSQSAYTARRTSSSTLLCPRLARSC